MNILRIHYNFDFQGGAEYDIFKAMEVLHQHYQTPRHLIVVAKANGLYIAGFYDSAEVRKTLRFNEIREFLLTYVAEHRIDIINIHSMPYPEVTSEILSLGIPVVRTLHEPMITCPGWARFLGISCTPCTKNFGPLCLLRAYTEKCQRSRKPYNVIQAYYNVLREQRQFYCQYSYFLVYSDYMKRLLMQHGVPEEKVMRIPSPQILDTDKITPEQKSGIPRLIFAGRVSRQKGILVLLKAYSEITGTYGVDIHLDVVGDGELLQELKLQVKSDNSSRIRYLGWLKRDEMLELFSSDCIVVIPSIYPDNFPNVVAEAMSCGAPVVASNAGGTSEWFINGESGLSYNGGDVDELVAKIMTLVEYPAARSRMGFAGMERIKMYHNSKVSADRYREIYTAAIANYPNRITVIP